MVEIREMKPGEEGLLMDLMKQQPEMELLTLEHTDSIYFFLDNQQLDGFLVFRPVNQQAVILLALETARDHWNVQDGLMRAGFNALCQQRISWVFAETNMVKRLLVLTEHFHSIHECSADLKALSDSESLFSSGDWKAAESKAIFRGACKGASDAR